MSEMGDFDLAEANPTESKDSESPDFENVTVMDSRTQDRSQIVAASFSFSGPLPSPPVLQAYGLVQPGLDVKIVDMLLEQTKHRQRLENKVIGGDGNRAWAGIVCAFTLSAMSIAGGIYLIAKDHDTAGTVLSFGSLASLAGVFVYGTSQRKDERQRKLEALLAQDSSKE